MSIGRTYSLSRAAKLLAVNPRTLKGWLAADLAMEFPEVERGSRFLILERDLEIVLRKRCPRSNWALIRGPKAHESGEAPDKGRSLQVKVA